MLLRSQGVWIVTDGRAIHSSKLGCFVQAHRAETCLNSYKMLLESRKCGLWPTCQGAVEGEAVHVPQLDCLVGTDSRKLPHVRAQQAFQHVACDTGGIRKFAMPGAHWKDFRCICAVAEMLVELKHVARPKIELGAGYMPSYWPAKRRLKVLEVSKRATCNPAEVSAPWCARSLWRGSKWVVRLAPRSMRHTYAVPALLAATTMLPSSATESDL